MSVLTVCLVDTYNLYLRGVTLGDDLFLKIRLERVQNQSQQD
jgi:acyl-CoA thioesterase FadM